MKEQIENLQQLKESLGETASLQEAIRATEKKYQESGYVICQYVINGLALTEEDESRLGAAPLKDVNTLSIRYETPDELLSDLIKGWLIEIPHQIEQADTLAQAARDQRLENNLRGFVKFIDSCQFLVESLISFKAIINLKLLGVDAQWAQTEIQFTVSVAEALAVFEKRDFVQLADVLEYDVADTLQNWFDLLKQIEESLINEERRGQAISFDLVRSSTDERSSEDRSASGTDSGDAIGV